MQRFPCFVHVPLSISVIIKNWVLKLYAYVIRANILPTIIIQGTALGKRRTYSLGGKRISHSGLVNNCHSLGHWHATEICEGSWSCAQLRRHLMAISCYWVDKDDDDDCRYTYTHKMRFSLRIFHTEIVNGAYSLSLVTLNKWFTPLKALNNISIRNDKDACLKLKMLHAESYSIFLCPCEPCPLKINTAKQANIRN